MLLAYSTTLENSQQAEKLFLLIEQCLTEANLQLSKIDLISVTNGPGSFTGVRIGLAAALGLRMAIKAKVIALSNFQVSAWKASQDNPGKQIAVSLDARREQVYYQLFDSDLKNLTEAKLVAIKHLEYPKNAILIEDNVNAKFLIEATEFYWKNKLYNDLEPLYIREPDVAKPRNKTSDSI